MGGGGDNDIPETYEQKALADVAAQRWDMFEKDWMPVRDIFIDETMKGNDASKYQDLADSVSTDAAVMFDKESQGAAANLAAQSVDPTSGRYQATMGAVASEAARITADTTNRAQVTQQSEYVQGLSNVVAMGEKKAMQSVQGLGDLASKAVDSATQSARQSAQSRSNTKTGLGLVAGAAYDMSTKRNSDGG